MNLQAFVCFWIILPMVSQSSLASVVAENGDKSIGKIPRNFSIDPTIEENEEECMGPKRDQVKNCIEDLRPALKHIGIPSDRYETETTCKSFFAAIACVFKYAETCFNQSQRDWLKLSYEPARDAFTFICKDRLSRANFYRHGDCAKKITNDFEACDHLLIKKLHHLDVEKDRVQICCEQRYFRLCIKRVTEFHKCDAAASQMMLETANRGIRYPPGYFTTQNLEPLDCLSLQEESSCAKYEWKEKELPFYGRVNSGERLSSLHILLAILTLIHLN